MYGQNGHVGRASLNLTCATLLLHVNLDISHRHPAYSHRASSPTSSISCSLVRNERRAQIDPPRGHLRIHTLIMSPLK